MISINGQFAADKKALKQLALDNDTTVSALIRSWLYANLNGDAPSNPASSIDRML